MTHKHIENLKGGEGMGGWIKPVCSCGWTGSKHWQSAEMMHMNAREEWGRHVFREDEGYEAAVERITAIRDWAYRAGTAVLVIASGWIAYAIFEGN